MSTSRNGHASKPPAEPTIDYENVPYGVFLECEDDTIAPVLLRTCRNRYEAFGWREFWKVDDYIEVKMRIRPVDAQGHPAADEAESEAVNG